MHTRAGPAVSQLADPVQKAGQPQPSRRRDETRVRLGIPTVLAPLALQDGPRRHAAQGIAHAVWPGKGGFEQSIDHGQVDRRRGVVGTPQPEHGQGHAAHRLHRCARQLSELIHRTEKATEHAAARLSAALTATLLHRVALQKQMHAGRRATRQVFEQEATQQRGAERERRIADHLPTRLHPREHLPRIAGQQSEPAIGQFGGETPAQACGARWIELDRAHPRAAREQLGGERAGARAGLQHLVAGRDAAQFGEPRGVFGTKVVLLQVFRHGGACSTRARPAQCTRVLRWTARLAK